MNKLARLFAMMLGAVVLPLSVLSFNMLYALGAIGVAIAATFILPVLLAIILDKQGLPKFINFFLTPLIIFPVVASLITVALTYVALNLVYNTTLKILESLLTGVKAGFAHGFPGVWDALRTQTNLFHATSLRIRSWFNGIPAEEQIETVDFDGFQRIVGELHDVVVNRENAEVPNIQGQVPQQTTVLLSQGELQAVDDLIKQFTSSKDPLSQESKNELTSLATLRTQYVDLFKRLELVQQALEKNDKSTIDDELIPFNEVNTPILLVKQYQKEGQWHAVPACSDITDKDTLLKWLRTSPTHTKNRDSLKKPTPYNGMDTQYIWHELTAENCFSVQELLEAAAEIRSMSQNLNKKLPETQRINFGAGTSTHSLFGANTVSGPGSGSTSLRHGDALDPESNVIFNP